jgi:hypothetical protein
MIEDDADMCAQCSTRQNAESNMTNMVFEICSDPKCGHKFCSNCLHDLFTNQGKRQFACKKCTASGRQVMVKREKLSTKSLDETEVEKDVRVRKKVKAIYNKTEDAFTNASEYRDYEEQVEDIIFNLVHDIDVEATQAKVKKYSIANEENIAFNAGKRNEQEQVLDKQIRMRSEEWRHNLQESHAADEEEKQYQKERKRQVTQLMLGERETIDVSKGAKSNVLSSTPATAAMNQQQQLANQQSIFLLLNPRELPKATQGPRTYDYKAVGRMSKEDKRLMHIAGGYDHTELFRKSWKEAISSVIPLVAELDGGLEKGRVQKMTWD